MKTSDFLNPRHCIWAAISGTVQQMARITRQAGNEYSSNQAHCFNILREASEILETEPSSGTASSTPKSGI